MAALGEPRPGSWRLTRWHLGALCLAPRRWRRRVTRNPAQPAVDAGAFFKPRHLAHHDLPPLGELRELLTREVDRNASVLGEFEIEALTVFLELFQSVDHCWLASAKNRKVTRSPRLAASIYRNRTWLAYPLKASASDSRLLRAGRDSPVSFQLRKLR